MGNGLPGAGMGGYDENVSACGIVPSRGRGDLNGSISLKVLTEEELVCVTLVRDRPTRDICSLGERGDVAEPRASFSRP